MAADVAAEVFAAALCSRAEYRPELGSPRVWLLGIAAHKTSDALRRGCVERRAQQKLGIREIVWSEDDLDHVTEVGGEALRAWNALPQEQRDAVHARIVEEREYREIARNSGVSEQVVRQRVSRGLAMMRHRWIKETR